MFIKARFISFKAKTPAVLVCAMLSLAASHCGAAEIRNFTINENTTSVFVFSFDDPSNPDVTYAISGGSDRSQFSINAQTGALDFITAPDFEIPTDNDRNNSYEVEVTAAVSSGGGKKKKKNDSQTDPDESTLAITVTVNDVFESPTVSDDHYSTIAALVISEDSGSIIFDVTANDVSVDGSPRVVSVGRVIVDSKGIGQAWRTTSRMADPGDTGIMTIEMNGEVSCAHVNCITGETDGGVITGAGLSDTTIIYRPRQDFNGVDSFEYCVEMNDQNGEPLVLCARVTINVLAVNDGPVALGPITYTTGKNIDLIVSIDEGLRNYARDLDNTHIDGFGCDPLSPGCNPGDNDPQPDQLNFTITEPLASHGQLFDTSNPNAGAFSFRPEPGYTGNDELQFQVCDTSGACGSGTIKIVINEGTPSAPGDAVTFDYGLAHSPLNLSVKPNHNVLLINDNSGSMHWDMMTDQANGLYYSSKGKYYYLNNVGAKSYWRRRTAPAESANPGEGFWRLRNSKFNSVYYNPEVRYRPWQGLNTSGVEFPDSNPSDAWHNPIDADPSHRSNLTEPVSYTSWPNIFTDNLLIPRYYRWVDLNGDGKLNATPSPATAPDTSEGKLIEIKPSTTTYNRHQNRTDCVASQSSCNYAEEIQNFANWFSYHRRREYTAKSALGQVVVAAENVRLGYGLLNYPLGDVSGLRQVSPMTGSIRTGNKASMLDAIYSTVANGGTPLRNSLRNAGRYFSCQADDMFQSTGNSKPGEDGCPVLPAPAGNCQQHISLLITDGEWTGNAPGSPVDNADSDNSSPFDGGAFAGVESQTLADVAMYYYERDLHPNLSNEVPATPTDLTLASANAFEPGDRMHQHMATFTVGFGVSGNLDSFPLNHTTPFSWGTAAGDSKGKTDDLRHAAYNGRGQYLEAVDGGQLAVKLLKALQDIGVNAGSGSAASFNSQQLAEGSLVFRASYITQINTGDIVANSLSGLLANDEVPIWSAAEGLDSVSANNRHIFTWDPDAARGTPFRGPEDCTAGCLNVSQQASFLDDVYDPEDTSQQLEITDKVSYLRGSRDNEAPLGRGFRVRPASKGLLGDIVHSAPIYVGAPRGRKRDRAPYPVGSQDLYSKFMTSHKNRPGMIYVGANDGMLHGFNAADGKEVFGYVPNNLMLNAFSEPIRGLLNRTYQHRFFVDLTPALEDVFMDNDGDGKKEWTSLLVSGQGAGGKAYFGLNVTDPARMTEARADEVVLWEFTDEDDAYPTDANGPLTTPDGRQRLDLQDIAKPVKDLGYSFSVPTLAMSNIKDSNGENEWVSVFGNGFNSSAGIAKLFVLFVDRGVDGTWCHPDMKHNVKLNGAVPPRCEGKQDFVKIDTGAGAKDGLPNGLGTPRGIDIDGNSTVDYIYAGDTFGNFYRFDLTSSDFLDWSVTRIFKAQYEDSAGNVTDQPILARPIITYHPNKQDYLVLFATGSYIRDADGSDKSIQSIYGLWDRLTTDMVSIDDLVQQRYTNVLDPVFGKIRVLSDNKVDYSPKTEANPNGGKRGWYNHLDSVPPGAVQGFGSPEFPGERAIRNMQFKSGLGFVNSVLPRSNTSCLDTAGGFALAFCPDTGGAFCLIQRGGVFDLDSDGTFDKDAQGQEIAGYIFEDTVPADAIFYGNKRITQKSDKTIDITTTNTAIILDTGHLSWKQLYILDEIVL